MNNNFKKATLGGGCFWCVEAIYQDVQGIAKVESGVRQEGRRMVLLLSKK